jgi:hypothetical protein
MSTALQRTCPSCGNEFSGAMEFCPVCMLRKALAGGVESGESSSEDTLKPTSQDAVQRFEHYELVTGEDGKPVELGRGAMGVTYKAFDVDLHCPVTLKVISDRYLGDESARLRFLREARAAALKRLQGLESIFYSRVLEALAKGRSDLISFALTDYRKITESLRLYEREVELAMRDSGQLISRGDAERGAGAVARWFRLGWRLWLSSCTPDLLPLASDPRAFKAKAEETFAEIMATVVAKARQAKIELPVWAHSAIREEYRSEIPDEPVPQSDSLG